MTDLAAFVSALWKRGTPLVLCPTTLEAQIDAAIGGKCGVNHPTGKNLIGTFHHAQQILIDPTCLETLSDRDFRSSMAESIKHGLIADADFLEWQMDQMPAIMGRHPVVLEELIHRNIQIKWKFVESDEFETGRTRMALNFGHSLGHAIETAADGALLHGECVSLGMVQAAKISQRLNLLSIGDVNRIGNCLAALGLPTKVPTNLDVSRISRNLTQDKKVREGRLTAVVLTRIGAADVRSDVPLEWFLPGNELTSNNV